jgi:hypothetical protein
METANVLSSKGATVAAQMKNVLVKAGEKTEEELD